MITRKEYDQAVLEIPQDVKVLEWNGTLGTFSFIVAAGFFIVPGDLFDQAIETYQQQYNCTRERAIQKALRVWSWCIEKGLPGDRLRSFYV